MCVTKNELFERTRHVMDCFTANETVVEVRRRQKTLFSRFMDHKLTMSTMHGMNYGPRKKAEKTPTLSPGNVCNM